MKGYLHPTAFDPRNGDCERHIRKGPHIWRDPGGICVFCGRRKGRRYPKP